MSPRRSKKKRYIRGAPHLFRQRGKAKIWSGFIAGREVSLGTADATAAHRRLVELAEERERTGRAPEKAPAPLLSELAAKFAEYIEPPRMSRKSAVSYQHRVLAFVAWGEGQGVTRADQVDFPLMSSFVKARTGAVKARTVNRDVVPIRSMFAWARRERLIDTNPFRHEDFHELKLKEPQPNPIAMTLSLEQMKSVITTAPEIVAPTHAALVALLAGSGLRIDEARHLEEQDVQVGEEGGYITVAAKNGWQPKSYRLRTVPVTRATCDAALEFIRTRDSARLDDKATWDAAKKISEHLGIRKFSMHDLRRAWATALHAKGMPLKRVSALLGHCGVGVTERYLRLTDNESTGHEFLPV